MGKKKMSFLICGLSTSLLALIIISASISNTTKSLRREVEKAQAELAKSKMEVQEKKSDVGRSMEAWLTEPPKSKVDKKPIKRKSRAGIYQPHLRRLIAATIDYLNLPDAKDWERLVLLTIAAESDMGRYVKQIKGPARGIAQLERPTEKDVLLFLKRKMPETYKRLRELRFPAKLNVHESEINLAYAIGMCCGEYLRRGYSPKGKSTDELVRAYKKHYNTYLGRATIQGVHQKLKEFEINI